MDEKSIFDQEVEGMVELLDEFEAVKELPAVEEKFYPINRAARRNAEKRNRALKKRKPSS